MTPLQTNKNSSNQVITGNIYKKVEEAIYSTLRASPSFNAENISSDRSPKIGCEIEFILFNKKMEPCSIDDSQKFLKTLSRLKGWRAYQLNNSNQILRVSRDLIAGTYHSVKYEHPPHLIEASLAPVSNLQDFKKQLFEIWEDLMRTAEKCNQKLNSVPFIDPPEMHWDQISKLDAKYLSLAQSRELLVPEKNKNEPWVHFPTYTAATQYHIGNSNWTLHGPSFIENLYRLELMNGFHAYELITKNRAVQSTIFHRRWNAYQRVFSSMELLGFPQFPIWTIEQWIQAFSESSLVVENDNPLAGETLASLLYKNINVDIIPIISKVRDLQIIKPKLIGTIEFRGDPALPTPEAILSQAAYRFGSYILCMKKDFKPLEDVDLLELQRNWWNFVIPSKIEHEFSKIKHQIKKTLNNRGLNEGDLL